MQRNCLNAARRAVFDGWERSAIFCRTREIGEAVADVAGEIGVGVPDELALIAFDWRPPDGTAKVDTVYVDRAEVLERAIDLLTAASWRAVRELVAPALVRAGSVGPARGRRS